MLPRLLSQMKMMEICKLLDHVPIVNPVSMHYNRGDPFSEILHLDQSHTPWLISRFSLFRGTELQLCGV